MDEVFEAATLIQTGKMKEFPIVVMGKDYWEPLLGFLRDTMIPAGTIEPRDLDRILVTDSPEEAASSILDAAMNKFGLRWERKPKWILGEKEVSS